MHIGASSDAPRRAAMCAMGGRCGRCPRCALRRRGTEREAAPWLACSEPWLGMAVNEASHGASLCIVVGPSGYTPIEPLLQRRKQSSAIGATGAEFMNFFLIPLPTRNAHPMPLMYLACCCSEPTNARTNHNKEDERRKKRYTTPRPRGQVHGLRSDPLVQSMQAPDQARSHAVMPCQWPREGGRPDLVLPYPAGNCRLLLGQSSVAFVPHTLH